MKFCNKCKEWKKLDEFSKDKNRKNGLYSYCKLCNKIYRQENKDKIKNYQDEYRNKNREQKNLNEKLYRKRKKDELKIRSNSYILWNNSSYPDKIKLYEKVRQNGEFLEVKCTYCGKWYKPLNWEVKERLGSINGNTAGEHRLYCSNNCKKECPIFKQTKWPKGFKKATSREVQPELRQMVLLRDNYTCQKCNLTQDELKVGLHCHHREGILWNPIESADIDICITYCKNCHKEVHKIEGCNYNDMKCIK